MSRNSGIEKVVSSWMRGEFCRAGNIWTDGVFVYSYAMKIAVDLKSEIVITPSPGPSVTTSRHINFIARQFPGALRKEIV